jgi:hypothetical protein
MVDLGTLKKSEGLPPHSVFYGMPESANAATITVIFMAVDEFMVYHKYEQSRGLYQNLDTISVFLIASDLDFIVCHLSSLL